MKIKFNENEKLIIDFKNRTIETIDRDESIDSSILNEKPRGIQNTIKDENLLKTLIGVGSDFDKTKIITDIVKNAGAGEITSLLNFWNVIKGKKEENLKTQSEVEQVNEKLNPITDIMSFDFSKFKIVKGQDISKWDEEIEILKIEDANRGEKCIRFCCDGLGKLKYFKFQGRDSFLGNYWCFANGKASACEWLHEDHIIGDSAYLLKRDINGEKAGDQAFDLKKGDEVHFCLAGRSRDGDTSVKVRSNVVRYIWEG